MNGTLEDFFQNDTDYGETNELKCGEYETYTPARFLFIAGASILAGIGMLFNGFLVYFFATHKPPNTPPTLYPTVLAILDFCLCFMYIAIMGADAIGIYKENKEIFILYHTYFIPAFVLAKATQMAIPYMLIFATLERLVWTSGGIRNRLLKSMYSVRGRYITVIASLALCVIMRLPVAWAIRIYKFPECDNFFRSEMANTAEWARESHAYYVYDFHFLVIAQAFIPFGVLLVLNFMVIKRLANVGTSTDLESSRPSTCSAQIQSASPLLLNSEYVQSTPVDFDHNCRQEKRFSLSIHQYDVNSLVPMRSMSKKTNSAVRAAIYTMLGIVTSYLISNSLHLILTVLERGNADILKDPEDEALASTFHTAFSDTVSFVYMFTSAIRLLIYMGCNPVIRNTIFEMLNSITLSLKKLNKKSQEQQMNGNSVML